MYRVLFRELPGAEEVYYQNCSNYHFTAIDIISSRNNVEEAFKDKLPAFVTILKKTKTLLLVMTTVEMITTPLYAEDED